ncbi:MAG: PTS sugar transporter subunit IIB [Erysipelotrichaceae bacterium]|nr:PTS sugar transporter subunit IIB [Erysipelotrichaceae bacterium]
MESGIIDVRVDDRMIHGIVATQWIPEKKATRGMVVNEGVANNNLIKQTLKMSVPTGVSLSVLAPQKAAENFKNGNYVGQRVFVVGKDIEDIYELFKLGIKFKRINLGNVTQNTGDTIVLDKTVRVNFKEKQMLKEMRDNGITVTCQFRPSDPLIICSSILD